MPEREPPCSRQNPLAMEGPRQGWPRRVKLPQAGAGPPTGMRANFSSRRTQGWRSSVRAFKPHEFKSLPAAPAKIACTSWSGCAWSGSAKRLGVSGGLEGRGGPLRSSSRFKRTRPGQCSVRASGGWIAFARLRASATLLMLDLSSSIHSLLEPIPRINGKIVQSILNPQRRREPRVLGPQRRTEAQPSSQTNAAKSRRLRKPTLS